MIYKIQDYYDIEGTHVREYQIIDGDPPDDFPKFVAVGGIEIEMAGMGSIPRRFSADIEADNVVEAFAKATEAIEKHAPEAVEQFKKEIAEAQQDSMKKIVVPQ